MKKERKYNVIGLMSGTSLDGLDIAFCHFVKKKKSWKYNIKKAVTIPYSKDWKNKLQKAHLLSGEELWKLHSAFGKFMGEKTSQFIKKNKIESVDLISSHGHTVFHQPQNGFTCQLGEGASIAAATGIKTVCDFRSLDVALGGQGAPLVPVGDELLFAAFDACLNIGGIANVSFKHRGKRFAFDICAANMVFNHFAGKAGLDFDKGGELAASGSPNDKFLKKFNGHAYFRRYESKSLGREWVEKEMINSLQKEKIALKDKLATLSEHAAFQIARVLNNFKLKNVLITGGGTYNKDLLNRIKAYTDCDLIIPDDRTIQFKEALIFAFLGVLRLREEINSLKEVTGASKNNCGGALYLA